MAHAEVAWASSDANVATVSTTGLASTIHEGAVTIRATASGKVGEAHLTVTPASVAGVVSLPRDHSRVLLAPRLSSLPS